MEFWKEYFIYDATLALTGGSGTNWQPVVVKIDSDSDFEWLKSTYVATNDRIKIRAKDDSAGRYLLAGAADIKALAGRNTLPMGLSNSFMPFIWPVPYPLRGGSSLTVEAADNSGVANTMRFALHGNKVRNEVAPWKQLGSKPKMIPFAYSFSGGAITVNASSTIDQTITLDSDSYFLVHKITGIRSGDALIRIGESARGRDWMNASVHIDNVIGNGAFPNILPSPRFLSRGSVILVNLQDLSGVANVIDITFSGVKIFI